MRKFVFRAAAWLATFGFGSAIAAGLTAVICATVAGYFGWAGNLPAFFAWGTFAAGAFAAAIALGVVTALICVALKISDVESIY